MNMRRRSFIRPNEKLRGIKRRIRSLEKWSGEFKGYFPETDNETKYIHWKVPVLDRMVEGRAATPNLKSKCVQELINAATHLMAAKPKESTARVTVLLTWPDTFSSEICIFVNEEYFQQFFNRNDDDQVWKLQNGTENLEGKFILNIPGTMEIKEYTTQLFDEGVEYPGFLWVMGELEQKSC